eukprot:3028064-Rhodomonas_salina.1
MYVDRGIPEASSRTCAGSDSNKEKRDALLKHRGEHDDYGDASVQNTEEGHDQRHRHGIVGERAIVRASAKFLLVREQSYLVIVIVCEPDVLR